MGVEAGAEPAGARWLAGVRNSRHFVLFMSQCLFARPFCKKEIRHALELSKPIVLLRETDVRHGALISLDPAQLRLTCAQCCQECEATKRKLALAARAVLAAPGAPFPTHCREHGRAAGLTEAPALALTAPLGRHGFCVCDALNLSLIYGQGQLLQDATSGQFVVDGDALQLCCEVLCCPRVVGAVRWFPELEFREARPVTRSPSRTPTTVRPGQAHGAAIRPALA